MPTYWKEIYESMTPEERKEWDEKELRELKNKQLFFGKTPGTFQKIDGSVVSKKDMTMPLIQNNAHVRKEARRILKSEDAVNKFMYARNIEKYFNNHFAAIADKLTGKEAPKISVPKTAQKNVNEFVNKLETDRAKRGLDTVVYQGEPDPNYKKEIKPTNNEFKLSEEEQYAFDQEEKRLSGLNDILKVDDNVQFGDPSTWDMKVPEFMQKEFKPEPDPDLVKGLGSLNKRDDLST